MSTERSVPSAERSLALDVFRGLTIALMILVNTPGKGAPFYPFLVHAKWFGFTLADLVFPSFLFIMGTAMSFSQRKFDGKPASHFWSTVLKRTFWIFLAGYLMYWFPFFRVAPDGSWLLIPFETTRVMGVLQRIALCFLFGSIIIRYASEKAIVGISAAILLLYWGVVMMFGDAGAELTIAGNAGSKFDVFMLGIGHVYKKDVIPFDPEGLLSTLPAIVNVLFGYLAGLTVKKYGKSFEGIAKLMLAGAVLMTIAVWWDLSFPIMKKMWTSPFVLLTVGLDLQILAALIYAVDVKQQQFSVPVWTAFGKNPLVIYLFSELFYTVLTMVPAGEGMNLFSWFSIVIVQALLPGPNGAFATAVIYTAVCWALAWWMDRRKIYVRL